MNLKIPSCYWGGEPIRIIDGEELFNSDDLRILKRWSDFLSDPAKGEQLWIDGLPQGRTWLDLSSADGKRRLLLRVFYHEMQGARPLWFFSAFSFDTALAEPATWAAAIRHLLIKTEKKISEAKGCIELDVISLSSRNITASPLGIVFRGAYDSALDRYCEALSGCQWDEIGGLFSASHPPGSHQDFTTLLIAEDFCYQGIRVIKKAVPATPQPTPQTRTQKTELASKTSIRLVTKTAPFTPEAKPQNETQVTDGTSKTTGPLQILLLFKIIILLAFAFFVGFFLRDSQYHSIQNSLEEEKQENQDLRAQNRKLLAENQKNKIDIKLLREQHQKDSPSTKVRQSVSPADGPSQIRNP